MPPRPPYPMSEYFPSRRPMYHLQGLTIITVLSGSGIPWRTDATRRSNDGSTTLHGEAAHGRAIWTSPSSEAPPAAPPPPRPACSEEGCCQG